MTQQIQFDEAVQILQKMIDGEIAASIQIEYEVYWGNDEKKRTLTARYDAVDGEVVHGWTGQKFGGDVARICTDTKWFENDFGARLKPQYAERYATRFYLLD